MLSSYFPLYLSPNLNNYQNSQNQIVIFNLRLPELFIWMQNVRRVQSWGSFSVPVECDAVTNESNVGLFLFNTMESMNSEIGVEGVGEEWSNGDGGKCLRLESV
ncbi:hypothetical protein L2E82_34137 [Cichorium intybus]|uniref:Uncharacterized protein n=1 Tax=Cichorium intybus TaxID=13427 RepID=A0ACB9BLL2_CICIN|nr:hypothetical protein L2E82_34137 [Cichorium intybus]